MEQKQEYATFGRQVGYIFGANIALLLLGFIRLPILTKELGVYLYGIWALIHVTISFIVPFAMLTFSMSIVRFLAAEKDMRRIREDFISACFIVFISGTVFSILLFILSDRVAAAIFKDVDSSFYIKLASILILLDSIYFLLLAFYRMRGRIGLYTIFNLIYNGSQLGLIVTFILLGYKLTGAIIAVIINGAIFNLIILLIILRQIGFQLPRFSHAKSYLKWGIPLTPNAAIIWIIQSSDRYMVSYFLGIAAVGIYSAAYSIGYYVFFFLTPVVTVLYPIIAKYYDEGNLSKTKNYLKYSIKYVMMIVIPSAFGLSSLAKLLLKILTTSEFVVGSNVVPFVALSAVPFCLYQIPIFIVHLVNKTYIIVRLLSISAVLNILLNVILIPRFGILGAAVATLVAYSVLGILTLVVTRRYLKFDLDMPCILKSILSSAIMALLIWMINPTSIVLVTVSIFAGATIYFGLLLLTSALSKEEIAFFMNFLKENLRKIQAVR